MLMIDPVTCLAAAIYFEARSEWEVHQVMVADTIINRKVSKNFPDTICGVIKQKHQFTFYWDGVAEHPADGKAWNTALLLSKWALGTEVRVTTACHYAATHIDNYWTKVFNREVHGNHAFYTGGC